MEPSQATSEPAASPEPANAPATHNHDNSAVSEDISRQADAILARLKNANKPQVAEPPGLPQVAEPQVAEPQAAGQEERILADIEQQQREVTDSQLLVDIEQPQTSLPLPDPVAHQDDSEMLVVNQEASASEPTSEPETFPMTDSPVSLQDELPGWTTKIYLIALETYPMVTNNSKSPHQQYLQF